MQNTSQHGSNTTITRLKANSPQFLKLSFLQREELLETVEVECGLSPVPYINQISSSRTRFIPVNVIVNRPSNTKLRPQVKQARAANKNDRCNGAARLL